MTRERLVAVQMLPLAIMGLVIAALTACRHDLPAPAIPTPVTPEVSRGAPKPRPIDPKHAPKPHKVGVLDDAPSRR